MIQTALTNEIRALYQNKLKQRPFIVGIDGLGGAGKTTFINQLQAELQRTHDVITIHMDDHIVERNRRYDTGQAEWYEYYYLQWDVRLLTERLFKKLHSNAPCLTLPFYDKSVDRHSKKKIVIRPDSIILIEGVFIQRREWRPYYDFTIFLQCPKKVRIERVLKRDTYLGDELEIIKKYERRYWLGENYYLKKEHPERLADRVVDII